MRTTDQLAAELSGLGSDYQITPDPTACYARVEVKHLPTGAACSVCEQGYPKDEARIYASIEWSFTYSNEGKPQIVGTRAKGKNLCQRVAEYLEASGRYDREILQPRIAAHKEHQRREAELRSALKEEFGLDTSRGGCYLKANGELHSLEQRGSKVYLHLRDIDLATLRVVMAALKGLERKEDEPVQENPDPAPLPPSA